MSVYLGYQSNTLWNKAVEVIIIFCLEHLQNRSLILFQFICGAFKFQEPGRNSEILNGIREVRPGNGYVPGNNFVLTSKYDVNGDAEHPLFTYMKVSESISN